TGAATGHGDECSRGMPRLPRRRPPSRGPLASGTGTIERLIRGRGRGVLLMRYGRGLQRLPSTMAPARRTRYRAPDDGPWIERLLALRSPPRDRPADA